MEVLGTQTILQVRVSSLLHGVPVVAATRFHHLLLASTIVLFYKIAGSLLQKMCSIHPGKSLANSIKAGHHTDIC